MIDPNELESELARMQPRKISAALEQRIEEKMNGSITQRWADQILLSAIGIGAAAACVIAFFLVLQSVSLSANPQSVPAPSAVASHFQSLATADESWSGLEQQRWERP